jgi:Meiotically up-regulated gene 113
VKVYLAWAGPYWKIGISRDPDSRLIALQSTKLPFLMCVIGYFYADDFKTARWVERQLHIHFNDQRVRGEWFVDIDGQDFMDKGKELLDMYRINVGVYPDKREEQNEVCSE